MADYTAISSGRVDADSPLDADLMGDLADNDSHEHAHAMRCGTYGAAVRRVFACGNKTGVTVALDGSGNGVSATTTVTFASDCDDGAPNFTATPGSFTLTPRVTTTGGLSGGAFVAELFGTSSVSEFNFRMRVHGGTGSGADVVFTVFWTAIGKPSTNE